jgi:hypothetical protein
MQNSPEKIRFVTCFSWNQRPNFQVITICEDKMGGLKMRVGGRRQEGFQVEWPTLGSQKGLIFFFFSSPYPDLPWGLSRILGVMLTLSVTEVCSAWDPIYRHTVATRSSHTHGAFLTLRYR